MRVVGRVLRSAGVPLNVVVALAVAQLGVLGCGQSDSTQRPSGSPIPAARGLSADSFVDGESAQYTYDGAGNLLQISAAAQAQLSVVGFSPEAGGFGDLVSVFGAGFAPESSQNDVQLGGLQAVVVSATPSMLTFLVPPGATTGRITVASGGSTSTSVADFAVVTEVHVASFRPQIGSVGTVLTIAGYNFDPNAALDSLAIGQGTGAVTSASSNYLLADVDPGATSGKLVVSTLLGTGESAEDFFLLPGSYAEWDIGFLGRVYPDSTTSVSIASPGRAGLLLFDGLQGQRLTLYLRAVTLPGATQVVVYKPDGTSLFSQSGVSANGEFKFALPDLPSSGTYTAVVQPAASSTGSLDLQVVEEAFGVLEAGTATSMTLVRGQNGRLAFAASAGELLSLAFVGVATTPAASDVYVDLYAPDRARIVSSLVRTPTSWQLPLMPQTGTYVLLVRPAGTAGADLSLLMAQPNLGTVLVDGPEVQFQNSSPGQTGRYQFLGNAGDEIGVGVSVLTTTPANASVTFKVLKPDGNTLYSFPSSVPTSWQLPQLPTTGTYTLVIQPSGTAMVTTTALLSGPLTGTLEADGATVAYQTARIGQLGSYRIDGIAGQRLTLQVTAGQDLSNSISVSVNQPGGARVDSYSLTSNADVKLDLKALPVTGAYTVSVVPYGTATGSVSLRLLTYASGGLSAGDSGTTLGLGTAQNGWYSFSGNTGDQLGFAVTSLMTSPLNATVWFYVYRPDGGSLWSTYTPSAGGWQLPTLPTSGMYSLYVAPSLLTKGTTSASAVVLLSRPLTGTLTADGAPATFQTTRAAQTGRYTFSGTTGQRLTIQATAGPSLNGAIAVTVYQPSGASIAAYSLSAGKDMKIDLGALPASGQYTVTLVPSGLTTGSMDLRLVSYASGALDLDAPPTTLTLGPAQNGWYTFAGAAGDFVGLGATALTTTPANAGCSLYVYKPDGASLWSVTASGPASWQLPQLPASGAYSLRVVPNGNVSPPGPASASLTLVLSRAIAGSLPTDGSPLNFQTTRAGQSGRYTFSGTAGQRFALQATAQPGLSSAVTVTAYQPSGASIGSTSVSSNADVKLDLGALPASGTYTVAVVPAGLTTGGVTLRLVPYAGCAMTVGGPSVSVSLGTAQNGWCTFAANAGAQLALTASALSTVPAGKYVALRVHRPDGSQLTSTSFVGPTSLSVPSLSTTGTYAVWLSPTGTAAASMTLQLSTR
jgi:hypothetical protein